MKCFKPLKGYRVSPPGGDDPYITFKDKIPNGYPAEPLEIRCQNCIGCRLTKARDWSVRIMHEASQHQDNSFITLTYHPDHIPQNGNLKKDDFTLFMKRLRKAVKNKYGKSIRFYMCGEYGTDPTQHAKIGRPHYHAIIFGHSFHEDRIETQQRNGEWVYTSPLLLQTWGKGRVEIGNVTLKSAGYVAGYVTKKINGKLAEDHYLRINKHTGQAFKLEPEYAQMSRKPGIGRGWYEKYHTDLDKGFITISGKKCSIPQFYQNLMDSRNPQALENMKERAKKNLRKQDQWNLEAEERQKIKLQKSRDQL